MPGEDKKPAVAVAVAGSGPTVSGSEQDVPRVDVSSLLSLPRFDGDGSLRRFLDDYDRYARIQGWEEDRKLDVLPLTLSGIARDAFDGLPATQTSSYSGAVEGLRSAFTKASVTDHHLALRNMRYSAEEPLDAFVIRFKKLMKLAFPDQKDLSPLLFSHFIATLPQEYNAAIIADGVSSFDAAVTKVRNIQSSKVFMGAAPSPSSVSHPQVPQTRQTGPCESNPVRHLAADSSLVDALTKRVAELEARLATVHRPGGGRPPPPPPRPRRTDGDTRPPVVCYCCGRPGHVRNRCRLRYCKCFVCGDTGHIADVCTQPRHDAPSRQENDPGSGRQQGVNNGRTQ